MTVANLTRLYVAGNQSDVRGTHFLFSTFRQAGWPYASPSSWNPKSLIWGKGDT